MSASAGKALDVNWTGRVILASTATWRGGVWRGGVWRHLVELAQGLTERGCDVRLALAPEASELQAAADTAGLRWLRVGDSIREPADIWHIHLHDTYERKSLELILARRAFGKVVITEHLPRTHASDATIAPYFERKPGVGALKGAFKALEFAAAARVIAVSETSGRFLRSRYRVAGAKVVVIQNGIAPVTPVAPPAPAGRPLRVVTCGNLSWQKGFDLLLEAAACSRQDWQLRILGVGAQEAILRERMAKLAPGRAELCGWVEDVGAQMLWADVLCMPSRWESFPYTALEANALSRPVVATTIDGLDEIVIDEQTGLLVATEDPQALATALDRLALTPDLVTSMGAQAERMVARYTLQKMVSATLETYKQLTNDLYLKP